MSPSSAIAPATLPRLHAARDLASLVGNTPLLPLRRLASNLPAGVEVWLKAEWFNPSGSVKARPARAILASALQQGALKRRRLLDATSGNMGIAYATLAAVWGIPVTLVMPANASAERQAILSALGAKLVLTDPDRGVDGAMVHAQRLAEAYPDRYYFANQYDHPVNWQAHYHTTGPEIWAQTGGKITHFVAGTGTGGTLMGAGRYLRSVQPAVQLIAVQPAEPQGGIEGLKNMQTTRRRPAIYDLRFPDRVMRMTRSPAETLALRLAREEGLFVGLSAAAAVTAALEVAADLRSGVVVALLPDDGHRYLSAQPWRGILSPP